MKKIFIFIASILLCLAVNAQTPSWAWAKSGNGSNWDYGYSICTDAPGNVYVTGGYGSSPVTFAPLNLTNAGGYDFYITKYDQNGNVIWVKTAGGTGDEFGNSICTDASGNIYVTGQFTSATLTFGTTTLTNAGATNVFTVKYDTNGNVVWAKGGGGTFYDEGYGIVTDVSGNIYVAGNYSSTRVIFGSDTLNNYGSQNAFILKYSNNGNLIWAKQSVWNNQTAGITSLGIDPANNLLITGNFTAGGASGNVVIDTCLVNGLFPISSSTNIFIAKLDSGGHSLWARGTAMDANGYAYGEGICADLHNNVYVTGKFGGAYVVFNSDTLKMPATNSGFDMFIVKYDPSGNALWTGTSSGCSGGVDAASICCDATGSAYVTGYLQAFSSSFGTASITNVFGGYVVKYTPSGTPVWVKGIDGWLGGTSVAAGPNQNVVVTGGFETDTATFDSFSLINACQTCNNTDIFVLSLNSLPTGIKENASVNKMNVYPVPTRDRLIVSFTEELKDATLDVLDILGNQLRTVRFSGKEYILEKDNLPPGVYIIRVTAEGEVLRRQVVIQ
jgi:hypothetical protein